MKLINFSYEEGQATAYIETGSGMQMRLVASRDEDNPGDVHLVTLPISAPTHYTDGASEGIIRDIMSLDLDELNQEFETTRYFRAVQELVQDFLYKARQHIAKEGY